MSTNGSTNNVTAIETDMRDILRERKARLSNGRETYNDYSSFVSGISVRSVQEIDHLIEGLQGLREKLNMTVTAFIVRSRNMGRSARR